MARGGDLVEQAMLANPDDPQALRVLANMLIEGDHHALAHPVADKLHRDHPSPHSALLLGACDVALDRPEKAITTLRAGLDMAPHDAALLRVLANGYVGLYDFEQARKYAQKSMRIEDHPQAHIVLAFCALHSRQWGAGWDEYRFGLGNSKHRDIYDYGSGQWRGEGPALIWAEQGLGDQIAYCSAVDERVAQLVCHPKLGNLLARSLPCEVHGDQFKQDVGWKPKGRQIAMSEWMRYTRRTAESFLKTPYLKPHPEKQVQWRALLKGIGSRPKVGIAWTGGAPGSAGARTRNLTLDDLKPLFDLPVDWVCLEYKDRSRDVEVLRNSGLVIRDWPWATQTQDYDDTAALVSCLDAVVCVPTTVYHLAGALGIPAHVIVHETPHFHEGLSGGCPWWKSVQFYRRSELGVQGAVQAVREAICASL